MSDRGTLQLTETRPHNAELLFDRYLGALLGIAVADALGWITEFRKSKIELQRMGREYIDRFITWSKPTGGRFHTYIDYVNEGEYSDDTQLTLCSARSLQEDGRFDPVWFTDELEAWLDYARGAGAAITAAARHLRSTRSARWNDNFYGSEGRQGRRGYIEAGGNGAAMRVAPHALANRNDAIRTSEGVWQNSVTTHGHPRAVVGALAFAEALRVLADVSNITTTEWLSHLADFVARIAPPEGDDFGLWERKWESSAGSAYRPRLEATKTEMLDFLRLASGNRPLSEVLVALGCFKPATKGSGTACVAAAIAAFLREPADYRSGVLTIVNTLGIDTDTIGAMYGALVGIRGQSTRIPEIWASRMQDYEYFILAADALAKIALRTAKENELRVDASMIREREGPSVAELTRDRRVTKGQRVMHQLLGPGWVHAVSEQVTKSHGQMLLADVVLDSGQSVKFKSFKSAQARGTRRTGSRFRGRQGKLFGGGQSAG